MNITMKIFKEVGVKIDLYKGIFLAALALYFIAVVGNYAGEKLTYLVTDCVLSIIVISCVSMILIWRRVSKIISDVENQQQDASKTKEDILRFPFFITVLGILKTWGVLVSIVFLLMIQIDLTMTNIIQLLLIIPITFFIDFNMSFFNTENALVGLLKNERILNTVPDKKNYRTLSINARIFLVALSVLMIPAVIFGYFIYLLNTQQLVLSNIYFHLSFIIILSLVVIAISLSSMAKNMRQSVGALVSSIESIKNGDFSIEGVPMLTTNEIGVVCQNANALLLKLRDVIVKVKESSSVVTASSLNINEAAQSLSQAANEQSTSVEEMASSVEEMASSMEEISTSMEEMSATISLNAQNAKKTDEIARLSAEQAAEGGRAVEETVTSMRQIRQKVNLIEEIAAKTDLLALNAAIEAARAGEHGKGFAVVASEIRKLAEKSQTSANEIVEHIVRSVEVSERAGELLSAIVPAIRKTADLVQDITDASAQQDAGMEQINTGVEQISSGVAQVNTGMEQLNGVTQQNASSAEELAATADALSLNAKQLREMMEYFKLKV
jgi:X-X-X-Leu-X-X-Gly heptad repeat protein